MAGAGALEDAFLAYGVEVMGSRLQRQLSLRSSCRLAVPFPAHASATRPTIGVATSSSRTTGGSVIDEELHLRQGQSGPSRPWQERLHLHPPPGRQGRTDQPQDAQLGVRDPGWYDVREVDVAAPRPARILASSTAPTAKNRPWRPASGTSRAPNCACRASSPGWPARSVRRPGRRGFGRSPPQRASGASGPEDVKEFETRLVTRSV